jgi:hypothetical protein
VQCENHNAIREIVKDQIKANFAKNFATACSRWGFALLVINGAGYHRTPPAVS